MSLTLHAEQAALAHAAAHGEYAIAAVACIGNQAAYCISGGIIYPCHLCKQLLWESHLRSGIHTKIWMLDVEGNIIQRTSLLELIHLPWPHPLPFKN